MDKIPSLSRRFIQSPLTPLLLTLVFSWVFFGMYMTAGTRPSIASPNVADFVTKYALYVGVWLCALILLKSYILYWLTTLLRLRFALALLIAYLLIYGTLLAVGIQLAYFEPRNTDIAIFIIDYYAFPLLWASAAAVFVSFVFTLIKKRA